MRIWRVGTVSMGAALILLGVLLLFSRMLGLEIYPIMMSWWPVILIVLGIEILIFLVINGKEKPSVKYDIFSILFIGFIGTMGIAFTIVSSLGISDEVRALISSQEETRDLPVFEQQLTKSIKRIVIETDRNPLVIEGTNSSEFTIFGTYRARFSEIEQQLLETANDYVSTQQKGDTLYVTLKRLPERNGWNYSYSTISATMLVPSNVNVEVRGSQDVVLRPRIISSDFLIEQASNVAVHLPLDSNVLLKATNIEQLDGSNLEWDLTTMSDEKHEGASTPQNAQIQLGTAENKISILNSNRVSVYK